MFYNFFYYYNDTRYNEALKAVNYALNLEEKLVN